jgi:hypothetical protein
MKKYDGHNPFTFGGYFVGCWFLNINVLLFCNLFGVFSLTCFLYLLKKIMLIAQDGLYKLNGEVGDQVSCCCHYPQGIL